MYSDPQSVTINAVAKSLPRIGATLTQSKYQFVDGSIVLSINQTSGRRNQHRARLDNTKIITDPFASDRSIPVSMSCYLVVDVPPSGYSVAEQSQQVIALADWLKAGTNTDRLIGFEL